MRKLFVHLFLVSIAATCLAQSDSRPANRSLNSYFPFQVPDSEEAWQNRRQKLRSHVLTSLGLNPLPVKTPLNPVIFGSIDQGDYVIKKVYFESMPGFWVTGNLYKPKNITTKIPAVLCPHGHHRDGRFHTASKEEIDAQIAKGAETFRNNARSPLQARCAHLARMGCIVFHYDMLGYADSQQIPYSLAHGFTKQREQLNSQDRYGFFSPLAESRSQSIMGLQTWNSIRVLDFLETLQEVDTERIGVTGASGGGTQTFILCAIDDRPAVSFPAVMVSTAMQGGCTCENCCHLRVETGNVELAAMFAPKPMGLTAANDWTKEMETKGFPELQQLYSMLGNPDQVELTSRIEFEHNYNQVCREAMYRFFAKHLDLDAETKESEIKFVDPDELSVINDSNRPQLIGQELEAALLAHWHKSRQKAIGQIETSDSRMTLFRNLIGDCLGDRLDPAQATMITMEPPTKNADGIEKANWEMRTEANENFSIQSYTSRVQSKEVVVLVGQNQSLLGDLITTGHHVVNFQFDESATNQLFNNGRAAAGYTYGYNRALFAKRTRKLLGLVRYLGDEHDQSPILVAADDTSAPMVLMAGTQLSSYSKAIAISDLNQVGFATTSLTDKGFQPGANVLNIECYLEALGDQPSLFGLSMPSKINTLDAESPTRTIVGPDEFFEVFADWCSGLE